MSEQTYSLLKLVIFLVAALCPMYLLAGKISADEYIKSGIGVAFASAVFAAFRIIEGKREP